jgi:crotonobetainyl-CoA:carnitine CoA-transferase CaiB-like acyl-CoA transferase
MSATPSALDTQSAAGPLAGIRIVDMTSVVFGPFATVQLADLGAEVIKIENPGGGGEVMRNAGRSPIPGMGPIYIALNRNKKSVTLDVGSELGREALTRLLRDADVFIHNVRMAGMERLGFGYEAVRAIREDIVYVHCAGFGAEGPYAKRQAFDDLIQGASGFADLSAKRDGGEPSYAPSLIADKTSGLYAYGATLAALFHRERSGVGQFVQVPMLEAFTHFHMVENLYGETFMPASYGMAYTRSVNPRRKPYRTADGFICIVPYSDAQWERFFELGERPGVFADPRFSPYRARTENIGELYAIIEDVALTRTTDEWLTLLEAENIPGMRFNTNEAVLEDPHLEAVGFFCELLDPALGRYRTLRPPVHMSASPASIRSHPPQIGADNQDVLGGLGFSAADLEALLGAGG